MAKLEKAVVQEAGKNVGLLPEADISVNFMKLPRHCLQFFNQVTNQFSAKVPKPVASENINREEE